MQEMSQNQFGKKGPSAADNNLHSAMHYVQNAVEGAVKTSQDATQNLVNNVMKQRNSGKK